jgi:hypothetical protein
MLTDAAALVHRVAVLADVDGSAFVASATTWVSPRGCAWLKSTRTKAPQ